LSRRLITAVLVLAATFAVGVGAAVVWQKVNPSDDVAASAGPPTTGPTATAPPTGAPTPAAPVPVPADWVAYTAAAQRATFSHPPTWTERSNETGVFFHEPSASGPGLQMIGVARVEGMAADAALTHIQQTEFGSAGLTNLTPGTPAPAAGSTDAFELTGSYDRQGARVAYVLRSVPAGGAVYVLFARTAATAAQQRSVLLQSLLASFHPA
jgi:hypothetical protein